MPNPVFPTYAKPVFDGFMRKRDPAVLRTEMEGPVPKQTKMRSSTMVRRQLTVQFESLANYNAFIAWFNVDISRGAAWFDWTDPVDKVVKLARIVNGELGDERAMRKQADYWRVGPFSIEVRDA